MKTLVLMAPMRLTATFHITKQSAEAIAPRKSRCRILAAVNTSLSVPQPFQKSTRMAAANARKRLSELAIFMKMRQMPGEEAGISLPAEAFASDSYTLSAEEEQKLRNQAEGFLEFIKR